MDEGVDDAGQEYGHKEDEHANLFTDPLLKLVQVPGTTKCIRLDRIRLDLEEFIVNSMQQEPR